MPVLANTGGDAGEGHEVACYFPARFHDGTRTVAQRTLSRRASLAHSRTRGATAYTARDRRGSGPMTHTFARITRLLLVAAVAAAALAAVACGSAVDGSPAAQDAVPPCERPGVRQSTVDAVRAEGRSTAVRTTPAGARRGHRPGAVRQEAERLGVSADQAEPGRGRRHTRGPGRGRRRRGVVAGRGSHDAQAASRGASGATGVLREAVQGRYADVGVGEAKVRRFYTRNLKTCSRSLRPCTWQPSSRATRGSPPMPSKRIRQGYPLTRCRGSSPSIRSSRTPAATWAGSRPPRSPRASGQNRGRSSRRSAVEAVQGMGGGASSSCWAAEPPRLSARRGP